LAGISFFLELSKTLISQNADFIKFAYTRNTGRDFNEKAVNIIECRIENAVDTIADLMISDPASKSGKIQIINCTSSTDNLEHQWSVSFSSNKSPFSFSLCVDCDNDYLLDPLNPSKLIIDPCNAHSYMSAENTLSNYTFSRDEGISTAVLIGFTALIPAPLFTIDSVSPGDSDITLSVNLTNYDADDSYQDACLLYCRAYNVRKPSVIMPFSLTDLFNGEYVTSNTKTGNTIEVIISGLIPSTLYDIYCWTRSSQGVLTTWADAAAGVLPDVTTSGFKTLTYTINSPVVLVNHLSLNAIRLELDFPPSDSLTISFDLKCSAPECSPENHAEISILRKVFLSQMKIINHFLSGLV